MSANPASAQRRHTRATRYGERRAPDAKLRREGSPVRLHHPRGGQPGKGTAGLAVWAPNAHTVSVIGHFKHGCVHDGAAAAHQDGVAIWDIGVARLDPPRGLVHLMPLRRRPRPGPDFDSFF